jgi:hypothetical protein
MSEAHKLLWEAAPHCKYTRIRVVVPVADRASPRRTHGLRTYLFETKEEAAAWIAQQGSFYLWSLEQRPWARSIFHQSVNSGSAKTPVPFTF